MILEVAGTSTKNKGAELMLAAIREHYQTSQPPVQLAVTSGFGTFDERAAYGLGTKLPTGGWGRWGLDGAVMPAALRRTLGVVSEADVDAVLDASGFAFGDQLGVARSRDFARDVVRWKRQGKPVVLLPQAFGPFEDSGIRAAFQPVVEQADLIFARDEKSLRHLAAIGVPSGKLRRAPDFTNLVKPDFLEDDEGSQARRACIVPNHRMMEKATDEERQRYVPFLASCMDVVRSVGLEPVILLHDTHVDRELVPALQAAAGSPLPVISESDPRRLKGILGRSQLVIGSRFHALIGALSQAVPCVGAGWSHKYQMLFEDYDCGENLLDTAAADDAIRDVIGRAAEGGTRSELVGRLDRAAARQRDQVSAMWREVDDLLGIEVSTCIDHGVEDPNAQREEEPRHFAQVHGGSGS